MRGEWDAGSLASTVPRGSVSKPSSEDRGQHREHAEGNDQQLDRGVELEALHPLAEGGEAFLLGEGHQGHHRQGDGDLDRSRRGEGAQEEADDRSCFAGDPSPGHPGASLDLLRRDHENEARGQTEGNEPRVVERHDRECAEAADPGDEDVVAQRALAGLAGAHLALAADGRTEQDRQAEAQERVEASRIEPVRQGDSWDEEHEGRMDVAGNSPTGPSRRRPREQLALP